MSDCSHTRSVRTVVEYEHPWTGEMEQEVEYVEQSCEEDIDLHRYKCTLCGKIGYYSGAAKDYYEKGIRQKGIRGLE